MLVGGREDQRNGAWSTGVMNACERSESVVAQEHFGSLKVSWMNWKKNEREGDLSNAVFVAVVFIEEIESHTELIQMILSVIVEKSDEI